MGKIEIRKASIDDADGIVNLLENFYPGVPDHWRKIFAPRAWQIENDFPGYIIVDENKVVGFLGTIFSDHETVKGKIRICNLTTWYVEPNYRQHGLALFLHVMKIPNVSWTNLTAAEHTYEWLTRSGFVTLEDTYSLVLGIPRLFNEHKVKLTTQITAANLDAHLLPIHNMHQNLHCQPVLIQKGDEQCYCLAVVTRYKKVPLAKIYYMSNPQLFREVIKDIRFKLCRKLKVCYLKVEGDALAGLPLLGAKTKKQFPPRLYKSTTLTKEDITLLGSELFVLGI